MYIIRVKPSLKQCSLYYVGMFYELLVQTDNYVEEIDSDTIITNYIWIIHGKLKTIPSLFMYIKSDYCIKLELDNIYVEEDYVIAYDDKYSTMDIMHKFNSKNLKQDISEDKMVEFNQWFYSTFRNKYFYLYNGDIKIDLYALCYYMMFTTEDESIVIKKCTSYLISDIITYTTHINISEVETCEIQFLKIPLKDFVYSIYKIFITDQKPIINP